jgi:hypothetical protein
VPVPTTSSFVPIRARRSRVANADPTRAADLTGAIVNAETGFAQEPSLDLCSTSARNMGEYGTGEILSLCGESRMSHNGVDFLPLGDQHLAKLDAKLLLRTPFVARRRRSGGNSDTRALVPRRGAGRDIPTPAMDTGSKNRYASGRHHAADRSSRRILCLPASRTGSGQVIHEKCQLPCLQVQRRGPRERMHRHSARAAT